MSNKPRKTDPNIVAALISLSSPITGKGGKQFFFRLSARNENGLEHIAFVGHGLLVRDIKSIPGILANPRHACRDPRNKNYRNYYGIRKGVKKECFLKIVTSVRKDDSNIEDIITVFPTKRIRTS